MKDIQTRKDEVVETVTSSEQLMKQNGKFLKSHVCKEWTDNFVDESTGEIVPISRKEVIYERGTEITPTLISSLLFYLQSGEIKSLEASNQCRQSYETLTGGRIYVATAEIGNKPKKYKFLLPSKSIPLAIETLKDYIELNFTGGYRIVSVKEFQTSKVLEDKLKRPEEVSSDYDPLNEDKFYQINAVISIPDDGYEYNSNVVVKTQDLDKAVLIINQWLKENSGENSKEMTSRIEEAKILKVDYVVSEDFAAAYNVE